MDIKQHTQLLRETRMRLIEEAKSIYDYAVAAKRGLSGEEKAKVARIDAEIAEIEARVASQSAEHQRETEAGAARDAFARQYGSTGAERAEADQGDLLRRFMNGDPAVGMPSPDTPGRRALVVPVGRARRQVELMRQGASPIEAHQVAWGDLESRALLWDTGSAGSVVPTLLANTLYQYMEASTAMWRAPTTKLNTSTGASMDLPTVASHAIATQVIAQGTAIGGTDPTFGRVRFDAFKYGELVGVANEVIQDSVIDINFFLGRDAGRAIGRRLDTDLVVGAGSGQPRGVMTALAGNGAGSVTTGGSLITPTYEKCIDLQYTITDEYRASGSAGWLMRDATAANLRKIRSDAGGTTGPAMWMPSLTQGLINGEPDRFMGDPVYRDPNVASLASNARIMAYLDFNAYYVRHVGDIIIETDSSYAFNTDMSYLRAKWRVDGDLVDYLAGATMVQNV